MQKVTHSTVYNILSSIKSSTLVIVSSTSLSKLDLVSQRLIQSARYPVMYSSDLNPHLFYDTVLQTLTKYPDLVEIIGIGGGTVIDYAKFIAKHRQLNCKVIPSMLSTNAFATNKIAVLSHNTKHTENGVLPDEIILDFDYLGKSPSENLYGLADVFSIHNALRDWKLAQKYNNEVIDEDIWQRAMSLLKHAVSVAWGYVLTKRIDLMELFYVIQEAGYITNDYGSGRPESGSEHIFASALELQTSIPHALAVTLGLYIMEYLSSFVESYSPDKLNIPFESLGLIEEINHLNLPYNMIYTTVKNLVPRKDKYTLVDKFPDMSINDLANLKHYLETNKFKFA